MAVLVGTLGADTVQGTSFIDIITALGGDDTVMGMGGADVIDAGAGDDIVYTNSRQLWDDGAIDTALGGAGDDHIYGGYGDILNGGTGFDLLSLDLSMADGGIDIDFRPMTLASVPDLLTLRIDGTELSGFQGVTDVIGTSFADRIVVGSRERIGTVVEAGTGDDVVRSGSGEDRLIGGDGDDLLGGLGGKDVLLGGDGADRLNGGRGQDTLTGGLGADRFLFDEGESSRSRGGADVITDFSHAEGDKVSLSEIDAVAGGDDDRFAFIGSDRFSGTAGELRAFVVDGATFVMGDTNGDAQADFTIRLDGALDLVRSDFAL